MEYAVVNKNSPSVSQMNDEKKRSQFRFTVKQTGIALAVAQALVANVSSAAIITVNNGADGGAGCTFRDAIRTINQSRILPNGCSVDTGNGSLGTNDTIQFDVAGDSISLTAGEVVIESDVSINPGDGAVTIAGDGSSRLLATLRFYSANVSINRMTLTGGSTSRLGGGIFAALSNTVTLTDSTIIGNSANSGGGGIFADEGSTVTLTNSTIMGNSANEEGGGIFVAPSSSVTLTDSTIMGNSANSGGGIHKVDSFVTLTNSTISGNTAEGNGGGIFVVGSGATILTNCTILGNSAQNGGGFFVGSISLVRLTNSTVSGNSAESAGGGIRAFYGEVALTNSTISGNSANIVAGIYASDSSEVTLTNSTVSRNSALLTGGIYTSSSTLSLNNSIIAGNTDSFVDRQLILNSSAFSATSNNLFGDSSQTSAQAFSGVSLNPANIIATSDGNTPTPLTSILAPLANNGGLTLTHALPEGSPAVNAGDNSACPARDQRGQFRNDSRCDIGAFELMPTTNFFVVPLPNDKSVIFGL